MMSRVIIDVREPYEFATGHVKGAVNIPPADIIAGAPKLQNVPKDRKAKSSLVVKVEKAMMNQSKSYT